MITNIKIITLIKLKLKKKENFFFIKANKNAFLTLNHLVQRNVICYYITYKTLRNYKIYKIKLSSISNQKEKLINKIINNSSTRKLKI